jgi:hypothetical protein
MGDPFLARCNVSGGKKDEPVGFPVTAIGASADNAMTEWKAPDREPR